MTQPSKISRSLTRPLVLGALAAVVVLTGCENMSDRQRGTAAGAGIGAVGGAVLSSATGGKAGTGAVIGGAIGAVAGNIWSKKQEERRQQMEQATAGTGIDVTRTTDNQLKLNIPHDVSFDTNSSAIKPELRQVLDTFSSSLQGDAAARLTVIGHTDSTGNDSINNPLSRERAASVRDYLAARGVAASRVEIDGRGSREPIAENTTTAGRAKNRRVEIFVREPQG